MIALVEIAIMLCSVSLVAMPAIAAEQTTQEVSATEITTASEDDFVLDIYGNANEDDTIDMRDLTYVKLIFFGKKPETELANAKYDGKINPLDFIQIKLIIVGKEKELAILQYIGTPPDITEEPVTLSLPIDRIVTLNCYACEALCVFGLEDKIVGVDKFTKDFGEIAEFVKDKEEVGQHIEVGIDIEKVISLEPDVVVAVTYARKHYPQYEENLSYAGIPMLLMDVYHPEKEDRELRNLGWLFGKQERAKELINFEEEIFDLIEERVSEIPEDKKTRACYSVYCPCEPIYAQGPDYNKSNVYYELSYREEPTYLIASSGTTLPYYIAGSGTTGHNIIVRCGGINVFSDMAGHQEVDPEAMLERSPEIFIMGVYPKYAGFVECGYSTEDDSTLKEVREVMMSQPGWSDIGVCPICSEARGIHSSIQHSYIVKWLHPELFEDIDPEAIHTDWLQEFLGIKYKGVYAYPLPWKQD